MRLVFWNCGVAPTMGKRSEERATAVIGVVRELVVLRPAIIVLCEADAKLVDELKAALDLETHAYRERILNEPQGRSRWDLVVLFDTKQVTARERSPILAFNGGRELRASYPLEIKRLEATLAFNLFLSHWPSRRYHSEAKNRQYCAQALWGAIERLLQREERVVVLGDFNEEPHDVVLRDDLRASRDPKIVEGYPLRRLYNPSWWLASPVLGAPWQAFGTNYYKQSGLETQWHAVDQALTCHQWLDREAAWAPELRALRQVVSSMNGRSAFDHVPIELRLMR